MLTQRASGILLHITSLPGPFGSGDFGKDAYQFVDWLVQAKQKYWQVLPMGGIGPGNSPYMSDSAFAGNVLLIDLEDLVKNGWLKHEDLMPDGEICGKCIDFNVVISFRMERLRRAASNFFTNPTPAFHEDFIRYCDTENIWLHDYALFKVIAEREHGKKWSQWDKPLANRDKKALSQLSNEHADQINFWKFCQWCFAQQWNKLKTYANGKGISIIGDVPIFVAEQSADVWVHPDLFELDDAGNPTVVAGVPPDYFSSTGQRWGNPLYRWSAHEQDNYEWWKRRINKSIHDHDLIRIDHFRGFAAHWEIQAHSPDATQGRWVSGPNEKIFNAIQAEFPSLPIIAEDLGVITQDVTDLRHKFRLPGMRVLQFAFDGGHDNPHLPENYSENTAAYTGTHDNDTTLGWWHNLTSEQQSLVQSKLAQNELNIQWRMMLLLAQSRANLVIFPMQDLIGLGSEGRMNLPGLPEENWKWRFEWNPSLIESAARLSLMTTECGRA